MVAGEGAAAYVNATLSADFDKVGPGRAQYTLCCDETGGVVDDLIAYRYGDERGRPGPQRRQQRRGRRAG